MILGFQDEHPKYSPYGYLYVFKYCETVKFAIDFADINLID